MVEISVIMPVYNCEEYLKESIESVLNQSFDDFEFICVDDGSTDNSLKILQDFEKRDDRIQVFHQENKGGGTARNFALTKASGNYLLFIDSDDILYSSALEETHELIKQKNVDFLLFKAIDYDSGIDKYFKEEYFTMDEIYDKVKDEVFSYEDLGDLIFKMSATPWGKLYNLDFIKNCGAQFAEGIIFHDNLFFWDMLFASKRICFYNETLYLRRIHSTSIQESKDKRFLNIFPAFRGILSMFVKYDNVDKYKHFFYNWKVGLEFHRFKQIHDDYKNLFLDDFKEDLSDFAEFAGYDDLMSILSEHNRKVYEHVMEAVTYKEFFLLMQNYYLDNQVTNLERNRVRLEKEIETLKANQEKLEKKNKNLKNEKNQIKQDYDSVLKENKQLLNSKSWKITKPLRKVRNLK